MIVVDTNVIAYLLLSGEHSERATLALQRDPLWAAPILWRSEFHNVLALYIRKSILTTAQAVDIIEKADRLIAGREFGLSSHLVLELVAQSYCSAYDCEFVALALELGTTLVTADSRILDQFPQVAISLVDYTDF